MSRTTLHVCTKVVHNRATTRTKAQKLCICVGSEIETGRYGGSLSSQSDFCSSSDYIIYERLDPVRAVVNVPACQFRQDQVDCCSPSEEQ